MKKLMLAIILLMGNGTMFGMLPSDADLSATALLYKRYWHIVKDVCCDTDPVYVDKLIGEVQQLQKKAESIAAGTIVKGSQILLKRIANQRRYPKDFAPYVNENFSGNSLSSSMDNDFLYFSPSSDDGYVHLPEFERTSSPLNSEELQFNFPSDELQFSMDLDIDHHDKSDDIVDDRENR